MARTKTGLGASLPRKEVFQQPLILDFGSIAAMQGTNCFAPFFHSLYFLHREGKGSYYQLLSQWVNFRASLMHFPMPHKYFEVVLILNLASSRDSSCQILIRIYVFIYSFTVLLFLEHVTFHVLR
jgi:hypothetical protein